jgi:LmbE family N-acetylglucosaminyl deacetylase
MTTAGTLIDRMRALPYGTHEDILGGALPLILAPHPDDEVIGCGGLIATVVRHAAQPSIVFVTDGSASHPGSRKFPPHALIGLREREAQAAASILGVGSANLHFMRIRDSAAPHDGAGFAAAVERLLDIVAGHDHVLFAPWNCDPHTDHVAVHKLAVRVGQIAGLRHLSYPVWGWTLPEERELGDVAIAGWRLDVRRHRKLKLRALHAHKSQMTDLIDDDPTGFRLTDRTLNSMLSDDEVFLVNA